MRVYRKLDTGRCYGVVLHEGGVVMTIAAVLCAVWRKRTVKYSVNITDSQVTFFCIQTF